MAQTVKVPFPAWEGMWTVDEFAKILASLRPEIEIPHGHPRSIEIQHLLVRGNEDAHMEVKYWYPMQGTVRLEIVGHEDEHYGTQWTVVGLKATWKSSCAKKNFQLNEEVVKLVDQLSHWKNDTEAFGNHPEMVKNTNELEKEVKTVIDGVSIAVA